MHSAHFRPSHCAYPAASVVGIDVERPPLGELRDTFDIDIRTGSTVLGTSGDPLGTIAEVFLDNQTAHSRWAVVSAGGHRCLIPLTEARVDKNTVWVPVTAKRVTSAPHHDPATTLTVDDDRDFDRHYATDQAPPFALSVAHQPCNRRRVATTPDVGDRKRDSLRWDGPVALPTPPGHT